MVTDTNCLHRSWQQFVHSDRLQDIDRLCERNASGVDLEHCQQVGKLEGEVLLSKVCGHCDRGLQFLARSRIVFHGRFQAQLGGAVHIAARDAGLVDLQLVDRLLRRPQMCRGAELAPLTGAQVLAE